MEKVIEAPINDTLVSPNNENLIDLTIYFSNSSIISLNTDSTISDLKKQLNEKFLMREEEYELYLKDVQLLVINNNATIVSLIEQHNSKEFTIKSYKSKFLFHLYRCVRSKATSS